MDTNLEAALLEAAEYERVARTHWKTQRADLRRQIKTLETDMLEAQASKRDAVITARAAGMPVARIAKLTGLTRQRVYQIITAA